MTILPLTKQGSQAANEAYANAVSQGMWSLCAHPSSTTTSMYGRITHPTTGQIALMVGSPKFYVQPTADVAAFVALVAGAVAEGEAASLATAIEAAKGTKVDVTTLLPASIAANLLTLSEAKEAGWFESGSN